MYPTLFPYGASAFGIHRRSSITYNKHVETLLQLDDPRFQEHTSFMFTAFNVIQRKRALYGTAITVARCSRADERLLARVTPKDCRDALESMAKQQPLANPRLELLMRKIRAVTKTVPGSPQSRLDQRNMLKGMIIRMASPAMFITINPADIHSPVLAVEELKKCGLKVAHVGDGANDILALQEADVGISLSQEASIAAPFTCDTLGTVAVVVQEGPAALVTFHTCFKFMVLYSTSQTFALFLLFLLNGNVTDIQVIPLRSE